MRITTFLLLLLAVYNVEAQKIKLSENWYIKKFP